MQNITPEVGYNAGNIAQPYTTATSGYPLPVGVAHDTFRVWFGTGNSGLQAVNRATGDGPTTLTAAEPAATCSLPPSGAKVITVWHRHSDRRAC